MMLGAHLTPRARALIEGADRVHAALSDPIVELWLQDMRPDAISLQPHYAEGKSRVETYDGMVNALLHDVRAGLHVCGVFYGHPGVFAQAPHAAIARARQEGFEARMEPGISAEDCLYADLGIDPGTFGCQHYEASQFMFFKRRFTPSAYLVLWQIGIAGDRSLARFATGAAHRSLLLDLLAEDYPLDHAVIVYEAATLPIGEPRIETVLLRHLAGIELHLHTTLVIPPAVPMQADETMLERIRAVDVELAAGT